MTQVASVVAQAGVARLLADLVRLGVLASALLAPVEFHWEASIRFTVILLMLVAVRAGGIPGPFDLAFAVTLTFATWATVAGWYAQFSWIDWIIHAVTTGSLAAVLYLLLARVGVLPALRAPALRRPRTGVTLIVAMLAFTAGALWEFYELAAERLLGLTMIVGYGDTVADMGMDGLGGILAGLALAGWRRR